MDAQSEQLLRKIIDLLQESPVPNHLKLSALLGSIMTFMTPAEAAWVHTAFNEMCAQKFPLS